VGCAVDVAVDHHEAHAVLRDATLGHTLVGSMLLEQKRLNRYPAHHLAVLVLHARFVVSLETSLPCQSVHVDLPWPVLQLTAMR
jgi:hypothetical protein